MSNNGSRDTPKENIRAELRDEHTIGKLIKAAGSRVNPPQAMAAEVRSAVYAEWQAEIRNKQWHKRSSSTNSVAAPAGANPGAHGTRWLALAATLVLGVIFGIWRFSPEHQVLLAEVDRLSGRVEYSLDNVTWQQQDARQLPAQLALQESSYLRTDVQSLASLTLNNNTNIRMDQNTTIRLSSATEIVLYQGGVYVDSGVNADAQQQVRIITPFGSAEDIGTQFEVRLLDGKSMYIRVREGTVILRHDNDTYQRDAGQTLKLNSDGSTLEGTTSLFGDEWAWTQKIAPTFDIDNQKLIDFLHWVARETGSELRFKSAFTKTSAESIEMSGSIDGFTPAQSLPYVLDTTELQQISQTDGILLIAFK